MSVQDRNVDRRAEFGRRNIPVAILAAAGTDEDELQYVYTPRFNYRLTDIQAFAKVVAAAISRVRVCIVKAFSAIGAPQFGGAAAVTFTIEAFTQLDTLVYTAVGATAAQAFGNAAVVSDGFWGAWTVQIDGAQAITTKPAANVMGFLTESDAIKNAPAPDALNGLVGVLTINAVGANFIAGTTDTNDALVNMFNTIDRGGLFADLLVLATDQSVVSGLTPARLTVAGLGNLVGLANDPVAITVRSAGASVLTDPVVTAALRKFPQQGESGPDVATGLVAAQIP